MSKLLRHEFRIRRGAIIGWSIGIAVFVGYLLLLFPEFQPMFADMEANIAEIPAYQAMGDFSNISSFPGYLANYLFIYIPLLLGIYAIVNGTGTLAGEEENGTLELMLALPIPRWQIVVSKIAALGAAFLVILFVVSLVTLAAFNGIQNEVDTQGVAAADLILGLLNVWPIAMLFATLSLFLASYLPTRRLAAMVATITLVFTFFANNLAAISEPLKAIQFLYPFHYQDGFAVLTQGVDAGDSLTLLMASLALLGLALLSFQRRHITVGAWPWQRPRVTEDPEEPGESVQLAVEG